MKLPTAGVFGVALLASCASTGTEPHAMTAPQHEAAAAGEDHAAKEHAGQYDPSQVIVVPPTVNCPFAGFGAPAGARCYGSWTSVMNPAAQHLAEGKRHMELAGKHRAASQALRDAEARFCRNVPEGDRDISPFYHREDIVSAEPVTERVGRYGGRLIGAKVVFASLPGLTLEWLQRVVDCHLARNAVMGDADQTMSYCPLAVPHVKAIVRSTGNGFEVAVTSNDAKSAREVVNRAEALTGKSPAQAAP